MKVNGVILLCLLAFVPQSFGFNALIITNGVAGHVIPMFELAKGMHDYTLLDKSIPPPRISATKRAVALKTWIYIVLDQCRSAAKLAPL